MRFEASGSSNQSNKHVWWVQGVKNFSRDYSLRQTDDGSLGSEPQNPQLGPQPKTFNRADNSSFNSQVCPTYSIQELHVFRTATLDYSICRVWFLQSSNNLISLVALMVCRRCKLKLLVCLENFYTELWQLINLWYIDSNSYGHCKVVFSIIGFVKHFGLMLYAYHPYKVSMYRKSSLPINYWIQPSNPFPLSLSVKGLQRFVFLIIWWMM